MATNRKWTVKEDNKVIEAVKRKPENLSYCFYTLSRRLDRSPVAIKLRYYNYILPNISPEEPLVFIGSSRRIVPNTKVVPRTKTSSKLTIIKSKWEQFLTLFKK